MYLCSRLKHSTAAHPCAPHPQSKCLCLCLKFFWSSYFVSTTHRTAACCCVPIHNASVPFIPILRQLPHAQSESSRSDPPSVVQVPKIRKCQVQSERQEYKNTAKNIYTRKNINVRITKYKYSNPIKSRTLNNYSSSGENSPISLPSS